MKAVKRYLILLSCVVILSIVSFVLYHYGTKCLFTNRHVPSIESFEFKIHRSSFYTQDIFSHAFATANKVANVTKQNCRMDTCFDFSRCKNIADNVKIYVYPIDPQRASPTFIKITNFIRQSKYYEPDANKGLIT